MLSILAFGYYAISPLFRNVRANDALPIQQQAENVQPEAIADTGHSASAATSSGVMMESSDGHTAQPAMSAGAEVVGTLGHPASGTARIVVSGGKNYVRYQNFKTINGPDIYVYLAKDLAAKEYINIGRVRATEGNINYEIPARVNPKDYPYVLTWCKTFGVLFNSANVGSL